MRRTRSRSSEGFTLIDVSIMVTVMGILAVSMLSTNKLAKETTMVTATTARLDRIQLALKAYYSLNSAIPCPASSTLAVSNAMYRRATTCTTGVVAGVTEVGTTPDFLRIGAVPTRTLGLPDGLGEDAWGNQFTYVMVRNLATAGAGAGTVGYTSALTNGVINVSQNGTNVASTANDVIGYFIFSGGPDGRGTYSAGTTTTTPGLACGSAATDGTDNENCDGDISFFDNAIIETRGTTYFYDIVRWARRTCILTPSSC